MKADSTPSIIAVTLYSAIISFVNPAFVHPNTKNPSPCGFQFPPNTKSKAPSGLVGNSTGVSGF